MTREQWLEWIPATEYQELRELSAIEPVGSDALVVQMAIVSQSLSGGKLEDHLVLSSEYEETAEQIAAKMGWPGYGDNR